MADRSSAYIFGQIFELIDEHVPADKKRKMALKFWKESRNYDFGPSDMHVDEALTRLGLAKEKVDPRYPEDGPVTMYGPKFDE
jgi:hypothetical protein